MLQDGSAASLGAANAFAVAIALYQHWSLASLMLLYWTQSVVIGAVNFARIATLERFSTQGLKIGGKPVEATPETRTQIARFFALHYGLFHAGYLVFILVIGKREHLWTSGLLLCTAAFAIHHVWSYRYNHALDRAGAPDIGLLMFLPYARIVPMHLTILCGAFFAPAAAGIVLFSLLKTVADVAMHLLEHAVLGAAARPGSLRAPPPS